MKQVEIGWTTADAEPWTSKRAHIDLEGWGDEVKPAAVPEPRKRLRSMDGWGDAKPTIEKPVEVETGWEVKTQGARWTEGWGQPSSSVNNAQTIAPPPNEVSVTSQRPNDWTAVTAPSSLNPRVEVNTAMGEVETGWESKGEAPAVDAWTSVARGDEGPMDTETGWEMPPKPTPSDDWTVRAMQSMPVEKRDVQNGSRTAPSTHPRQLPPSPFPNTRPDPAQTKYDDPTDRIRSERAGGPVAREPLKRWFATDRGHFNYPEYAGRTLPRLSPAPMPELQPGEIGYYQGPYERSFPKRSIQPAPTHPSTSSAPCLDQEGARQLRSQVTDRQDPRHPLYEMSWQPTGPLPRTLFQERQHTGALRQAGYSPRDIHEHNQWTRSTGGCGRHAGPLSTDNLPAAFPLAPPSSSTASDPSFHYPAPSLPRSPPPRSSPPCAFPPPPPSSALPQTAHQLAAPTTAVLPLTPPHSAYGERAHEPRNGDRGTMRGWPPGGHRNNRPRPQLRGGRLLGQAVKGITPTPSVRSVGTQTDVSKDKTTQTEAWADIL